MANTLKTTLLLGLLTGVFVAVGGLLGGQSGMIVAFVIALAMKLRLVLVLRQDRLGYVRCPAARRGGGATRSPDSAALGYQGQNPDAEALPLFPPRRLTRSPPDEAPARGRRGD
jgi:hypothetical protein